MTGVTLFVKQCTISGTVSAKNTCYYYESWRTEGPQLNVANLSIYRQTRPLRALENAIPGCCSLRANVYRFLFHARKLRPSGFAYRN